MSKEKKNKTNQKLLRSLNHLTNHYTSQVSWGVAILIIILALTCILTNLVGGLYNTKSLETLRTKVAIEVVDMDKWNKVEKNIKWKKQQIKINLTRNPFTGEAITNTDNDTKETTEELTK